MSAPAEHRKRSKTPPAKPARAAWGRLDHLDHLAPLPPSPFRAGSVRRTLIVREESVIRRVVEVLTPPLRTWSSACRGWSVPARLRSRIFSQVRHSAETMRTVFGADRHAVSRHSSDVRIPSATASPDGVLHGRAGDARQCRDMADGEPAQAPARDLGGDRRQDGGLGHREPGRELRREPARARPASSALHVSRRPRPGAYGLPRGRWRGRNGLPGVDLVGELLRVGLADRPAREALPHSRR